jgi:hypothetical protein
MAAMLAAIEIYNKPQVAYRDETTVILVVNAWELALKAALRQNGDSIFYKKRRGERHRSYALDHSVAQVTQNKLWPTEVDGSAVSANLEALTQFRDRAIHLYNVQGLGALMFPFLQQSVLNFRDLMLAKFRRDLADAITWQLLPLGATAPAGAMKFMKADAKAAGRGEAHDFIEELRTIIERVEVAGGDVGRVATVYDINLQSVKKMSSADLVVGISETADGELVRRNVDANQTHPFGMKELLDRANGRRTGRRLTSYDYAAVCWKEGLRDNPKYAWRHQNSASYVWSGDAVRHFADLTDAYLGRVKKEYRKTVGRKAS